MKKDVLKRRYEIRGETMKTLVKVIAQQEEELALKDKEIDEAANLIGSLMDQVQRLK